MESKEQGENEDEENKTKQKNQTKYDKAGTQYRGAGREWKCRSGWKQQIWQVERRLSPFPVYGEQQQKETNVTSLPRPARKRKRDFTRQREEL